MFQIEELFVPGQVIFKQGERTTGMLLIISGTVEVSVDTHEGEKPLARFSAGDFLGDMALISNHPRAATAKALTAVMAEWIDDRGFEERVLANPDRRAAYLALLMQRISITDGLLRLEWHKQDLVGTQSSVLATRAAYLEALPATAHGHCEWLDLRLVSARGTPPPVIDVLIPQAPFTIGRLSLPLPSDYLATRRLSLPDKEPYQVSPDHCEIIRAGEGLAVRDLNSALGTNVNGTQIGTAFASMVAPLQTGSNTLRLGGPESHYCFVLELA